MAQHVFCRLGCGIRHVGEQAKGRHIGKVPAVGPPKVTSTRYAAAGHLGHLGHAPWQADVSGKIVGRAGGDIAQHRAVLLRNGHQAGDRLIEGAIPTTAYHPVIALAARRRTGGVPLALGGVGGDLIALGGEHVQHICQSAAGFLAPGPGVIDKEQSFHVFTSRHHYSHKKSVVQDTNYEFSLA